MNKRALFYIVLLIAVCIPFSGMTQTFTHGILDKGSSNQYFTSVSTLSNGDVVTAFKTDAESIGIVLPPGDGYHIDFDGTNSVISLSNDLAEVNWWVTSFGNDNFELDELVTDEFDNTYAIFTGGLTDPFVLNDTTLIEDLEVHTALVKIDNEGEVIWCIPFEGTSFYEDDKLKIGNGMLHVILPFTEDIDDPMVDGGVIPIVGDRDYYISQINYDGEYTGLLHLYSHVGYLSVLNYAISDSGKYAFGVKTSMSFGINGETHYTTFPDIESSYYIFEVSNDGLELYNSIVATTLEMELLYNSDERLVVGSKIGPTPPTPILGDTILVTSSSKIMLAGLTETFEIDWIEFYMRPSGGDSGEMKLRDLKGDCRGNYYLCGRSEDLAEFGDFVFYENPGYNNWGDAFVVQTSDTGIPQWLKFGGGAHFRDEIAEVAIDNAGNVFCAGQYMTECYFDDIEMESAVGGMHTEGMLLRLEEGLLDFPAAEFTAESTDICIGGLVELSFDTTFADTLVWSPVDMSDSLVFTMDTAGLYTYSIIASDSFGCQNKQSINIRVHDLPTVEIVAANDKLCIGDSLIFGVEGAETYTWLPDSIETGIYHKPADIGLDSIILFGIDTLGCANSDTLLLETYDRPVITSVEITDEYLGADGAINITVDGGVPEYVFDWNNDGTGDTDDSEDLTDLVGGEYIVVVTDTNGCTTTGNYEVVSFVGLDDNQMGLLKVYPNPTTDFIVIDVEESYSYVVMEATGKQILKGEGHGLQKVSLKLLPKGTYFLIIQNEHVERTFIIVRE